MFTKLLFRYKLAKEKSADFRSHETGSLAGPPANQIYPDEIVGATQESARI